MSSESCLHGLGCRQIVVRGPTSLSGSSLFQSPASITVASCPGCEPSLRDPGSLGTTSDPEQPTTTYATTYGWASIGIRRELKTPSKSKKRIDGTKRDQIGL